MQVTLASGVIFTEWTKFPKNLPWMEKHWNCSWIRSKLPRRWRRCYQRCM